jgi:AP endonuclease-1
VWLWYVPFFIFWSFQSLQLKCLFPEHVSLNNLTDITFKLVQVFFLPLFIFEEKSNTRHQQLMPPKKAVGKKSPPDQPIESEGPMTRAKRAKKEAEEGAATEHPAPATEKGEEATAPPAPQRRSSSNTVTQETVLLGTIPFKRRTAPSDFIAPKMLKVVSWNVAGLRATLKNGTDLQDLAKNESPDVLCLQEVKISDLEEAKSLGGLPGYSFVDCVSTVKKGYSGTRTYVRDGIKFQHSVAGLTGPTPDPEGRVITTYLPDFDLHIVNTYVPNSGLTLDRLEYRTETFDIEMRNFLKNTIKTAKSGTVIWTGDLNVAERDYDRFFNNWKAMQKCPGFTPEERVSFRETLKATNMVDGFRHLYPNSNGGYTFYSTRGDQRSQGNGWRLDYFVVSEHAKDRIVEVVPIQEGYDASDHRPLVLWFAK